MEFYNYQMQRKIKYIIRFNKLGNMDSYFRVKRSTRKRNMDGCRR